MEGPSNLSELIWKQSARQHVVANDHKWILVLKNIFLKLTNSNCVQGEKWLLYDLKTALFTPSSQNLQPCHFIVI